MNVKDKKVEIRPQNENLVKKWRKRAEKYNLSSEEITYGDETYEEVF